MATPGNPESIGEVRVNINADTTGLRTGIQEARAETERFGQESERAGQKAEVAATKAKGAFGRMANSLRDIQRVMRTLLIPGLIIGSVFRLADAWDRTRRVVRDYKRAIDDASDSIAKQRLELQRQAAGLTDFQVRLLELRDLEQERLKQVDESFEAYRRDTGSLTLAWRELLTVFGIAKVGLDDIRKATEDEKKQIMAETQAAMKLLEVLRKQKDEVAERDRIERQRLDTLREQERFSAARMSADISRMAQLLDIIRRQRGGRP